MNSLTINNLHKTYKNGVVAINDISLEITNGMFGLLGPNGAGKSSLMKTIAGLQKPDNGTLFFNGIDCLENPLFIKKQLGFLPQDFGVYPKISAYDLLTHIAILKGITNTKERKEQVNFLLEKVNLQQQSNKEVHTFSGGMRQRFGIAQALLGNPQLVIVDEPTAGLDPEERNRFNNLLNEISEDIIIILSTHLVEDVKNLCKEMAIIHNGTLLVKGKPNDFITALTGKLWQKTIDKKQVIHYEKEHNVVLTQLNMGTVTIHVQSDAQPDTSFKPILPNLEDVYFSILNQK
ncbi:ABC transporter ATP-binding protein [Flavobacterium sp. J27]|uniref:ABC transporter ATP-binding protein n=1 Tax=Flavobacterium sp. J27 TaxID=2060419 RepID=UPI0010318C61|nr:ABC transporter ATP-binding protein [Flavobacterium sp. J27]